MLSIIIVLYFRLPRLLETSLTYKPRVSVSYKRDENNLMVSGNLGFLLSSKYPLKQVMDMKAIKETEQNEVEKPEIISPVFNLNKAKTTQKLDTGFYDGAPFPHPHTLVIVSKNQKWTTSDLVAQGKVTIFIRLIAHLEKAPTLKAQKLKRPPPPPPNKSLKELSRYQSLAVISEVSQ